MGKYESASKCLSPKKIMEPAGKTCQGVFRWPPRLRLQQQHKYFALTSISDWTKRIQHCLFLEA